ncbi:glycerophosphodiester phosphodiesterase [bacterium (Candidatus Blackallbacteria) CG17_big_fil_post_rev_8_21_14_2_50_48_46]|uniref:glycerophosphodiester phosphodiesterase n=1 Tax=bacterium (Candidatus Blackallbacteria) CG17_big_fil_post_rev_8_21_14_2_50_48_46 TaxID=2014261 RepID=A0A2M7GAE9_9BACT|nr:MAG: glycerophosphodiester phosphodiesterase [bacterium (Candidatus Blackallbacteria) CG18_big_fil_WC_8_21_14_2_50_49_26]PIW19109.1 MAG: glycerophosphodiester phosphodiesterase [bacterium (Candidatus Blackallbacteria) CG17_big_fil_post_rev_8_21_14_2_50_48_46]PIW44706.1 MAG: glycerophosphodiester phosphodiesterase [bacterium (Candidatus Blackallbacteria) CG13_big_fil_rev_8_21_14_2_50_49_14]
MGTLASASLAHKPQPLVIAHRGACGLFPEHTLAAYREAIQEGADFIEPDVVSTKDGVLVVRHENNLVDTTDVAVKFPKRKRTKTIDGQAVTGWFSEDFTLKELKTLWAKQRFDFRPQQENGKYEIPTLEEVLQLLKNHQLKTGMRIGVYPETKHPSYFKKLGLPLEDRLLGLLKRYGYETASDPVFIQSFEVENLQQLNQKTSIRLIQLVESEGQPADFGLRKDKRTYSDLLSPEGLRFVSSYANGLGPPKQILVKPQGDRLVSTGLLELAHRHGLAVHPWTFRNESQFLAPQFKQDPAAEYAFYYQLGVDGVFSEFPDLARKGLKQEQP